MKKKYISILENIEIEQYDYVNENQIVVKKWFVYDSLNDSNNASVLKPILKYSYPERSVFTIQMVQVVEQDGGDDCGLLALAYAYDLSLKIDPYNLKYHHGFLLIYYNLYQ
ncbi:hypothetical protein BpHYR1_017484 [Brachionus plicatilis]|uniref:Ubiquitin-like protease family profile domain-containing protein n=1 Tax=Brachionus plicatilis TaxID=10195 RepID=A0A3M7QP61_BRAPC|nr:hypothetical protein BpHYR1_017484 [Brachionus plicatilis]